MYLQNLLLAGSCLSFVVGEPVVAPGPVPLALRRSTGIQSDRLLKKRPLSKGDSVCWSTHSICYTWGEMDDACDAFEIVSNDWYKCICETGWVSSHEACNWCLRAYGETELSDDTTWTDACERNSLPISPMPASILAIASSFNATNTYLIAGATGGSSAVPTGVSGSSAASRPTTGLDAGGLGSAFPSQTQASSRTLSATASKQTSTTTLTGGDAGAVSSTQGGNNPGATVTVTAGGGGTSRAGGSASGLDIKASATISLIVAMLAMVGIALVPF